MTIFFLSLLIYCIFCRGSNLSSVTCSLFFDKIQPLTHKVTLRIQRELQWQTDPQLQGTVEMSHVTTLLLKYGLYRSLIRLYLTRATLFACFKLHPKVNCTGEKRNGRRGGGDCLQIMDGKPKWKIDNRLRKKMPVRPAYLFKYYIYMGYWLIYYI